MSAHELSDRERDNMRHAVGADARRGTDGYRNHYVASPGSQDDLSWQRLVSIGYATSHGANSLTGGSNCYTVTRDGCAAIGLSKAAIIRACGSQDEKQAQHAERSRQRDARLMRSRLLAESRALSAIRDAKHAVSKARRALNRADLLGVNGKPLETIERPLDEAVSQ